MSEPMFLIWSNQPGKWWRPNSCGYTGRIEEAGRYARGEADDIVAAFAARTDVEDVWLVLAPECTDPLATAPVADDDLRPAVSSWEAAMSPQAVADAEAEEAARDAEDQQGWGGPDPKEKR